MQAAGTYLNDEIELQGYQADSDHESPKIRDYTIKSRKMATSENALAKRTTFRRSNARVV